MLDVTASIQRTQTPRATWLLRAGLALGVFNAAAYVVNGATALPCAPGVSGNLVDMPAGIVGAVLVVALTFALFFGVHWTSGSARKVAHFAFGAFAVISLFLGVALVDDIVYNTTGSHAYSTACDT